MKIYSLINLVLFVVAWGMGYVLWDWKDQLAEEFFRGGWENYELQNRRDSRRFSADPVGWSGGRNRE